jgi:urease accessory protein
MLKRLAAAAIFLLAPATAFAHVGHDLAGQGFGASFMAGFLHPITGADHLLAMLAVGLWAALAGRPALWLWPAAFLAAMLAGFLLAPAGVVLPFVEPMILASVIGLGILAALAFRPHPALGAALVALFGLFHGHAHGAEAGEAMLSGFGGGFLLATAALHLGGVAAGLALGRYGHMPGRIAGGVTALSGLALATIG